ncbi:MAG: hypothetical protein JHD31_02925, partial [Rhodoluna sp.]|nr:hypothetical protein [Rhodoluna sp.]
MFKSKRVSLLTIFALLLPSSAGLATFGISAANAASSHTALTSLTVDGVEVTAGSTVNLPAGTTSAVVAATAADATVTVTGGTGLVLGNNSVTVLVEAAWTETVEEVETPFTDSETFTLTLNVAAYDSSLGVFTVNGSAVTDGSSVELAPYTTSVVVVATAADAANTTVALSGGTALTLGENTLTAIVRAIDGTSTTYTVTLIVPVSDDATSVVLVQDEEVINGESIEVEWGTTSVSVAVTPTDSNATYVVTGATGLTTGDNLVSVIVTAKDGVSAEETQITVVVLPNTDTSVSSITVNGEAVVDGATVDLAALTTEAVIEVVTVDEDATVVIAGEEGLLAGSNQVVIIVTAADGLTSQQYDLTLNVVLNDDVSLALFTVGGFEVEDNDIIDLDPLTTEVEIEIETTDPEAFFDIEGGSDLVLGSNDLKVTVHAADGETTREYYVGLNVLPSTDTSLITFEVNGEAVEDGSTVELAPFTTSVDLVIETTDADATYVVDGAENLMVGENILTVIVTAVDDSTTMDYTVILLVAE